MALKIICIVFWICMVRALIGLVMVFRGRIFSIIPVVGALVVGLLLLAAVSVMSTNGELPWYESGVKSIADGIFPELGTRINSVISAIRAKVGGLFSSVGGLFSNIF
jgi:hypothetical protein